MRTHNRCIPAGQVVFAADGTPTISGVDLFRCWRCQQYLPADRFSPNATYCKDCTAANQRQRYESMSERKRRTGSLKKNYGITHDEYDKLWEAQGGVCAACGLPETGIDPRTHLPKYLVVDHDHATGQVRALLCTGCNTALGSLNEDPARIRGLLAYAKRLRKR